MRSAILAVMFAVAARLATGDELEMLSGQKLNGQLVSETETSVVFEVSVGGTAARTTVAKDKIHAITAAGARRVLHEKPAGDGSPAGRGKGAGSGADTTPKAVDPPGPAKPPGQVGSRTKAEVEALVASVAKAKPDWWDKVALNYPKTLDLDFPQPKPGAGWNNKVNLGQYAWDIINPNPDKWQEGVKLMHFARAHNEKRGDKNAVQRLTGMMGGAYFNLLQDWPRAITYWREGGNGNHHEIADCYLRLGCPEAARDMAERFGDTDTSRHGSIAKLWGDLGEFDKGIAMALGIAKSGREDVGYLVAGDLCRLQSRFDEAVAYYKKAAAAPPDRSGRDHKQATERASQAAEAVLLFEALDVKRLRDGRYTASHIGYSGLVKVTVELAGGKIVSTKVMDHQEKQFYGAFDDVPRQLLAKQSVRGIVPTTGATISAEAYLSAAARAMTQAKR